VPATALLWLVTGKTRPLPASALLAPTPRVSAIVRLRQLAQPNASRSSGMGPDAPKTYRTVRTSYGSSPKRTGAVGLGLSSSTSGHAWNRKVTRRVTRQRIGFWNHSECACCLRRHARCVSLAPPPRGGPSGRLGGAASAASARAL
jgi:hypothetical protein